MAKEALAVGAIFIVPDMQNESFERRVRDGRMNYRQKQTAPHCLLENYTTVMAQIIQDSRSDAISYVSRILSSFLRISSGGSHSQTDRCQGKKKDEPMSLYFAKKPLQQHE
jgi:hypothetical protein